jgi:hypothetical protein
MKFWWRGLFISTAVFLSTFCGVKSMDQIDYALARLVDSKTAAEEHGAAEQLVELARERRLPLNMTVYDAATGNVIAVSKIGSNPTKTVYVELSAGPDRSENVRKWVPKELQNIYILLRE